MKTHQSGPVCWTCVDNFTRMKELDRLRANYRARRIYVWKRRRMGITEKGLQYDMLDNTVRDLNWSARELRRKQAEHMKVAR